MSGKSDMNLGDLAQWCDDYNLIPGIELPDEYFIVSYCMFFDINEYEEEELSENYTLRELMPMNPFLVTLKDMVCKWSYLTSGVKSSSSFLAAHHG